MEVSHLLLLLKSILPGLKELILGKQTLKEALSENIVASTLLVVMVLMLIITVYINGLATSRLTEIGALKQTISELRITIDEQRLDNLNPKTITVYEECTENIAPESFDTVVPIPVNEPRPKEPEPVRPTNLRKLALDKLKTIK